VICLDELGPEAAKSFPGRRLVHPAPADDRPAERATQEIDYGRRESGYIFGAFRPATGEAFTQPYPQRTAANWAAFLERVEGWLPPGVARVDAKLRLVPRNVGICVVVLGDRQTRQARDELGVRFALCAQAFFLGQRGVRLHVHSLRHQPS